MRRFVIFRTDDGIQAAGLEARIAALEQKAGFNVEQVEAPADFMDTQAASKADLEAAERRLETKIAEVKADVALLSARMDQQNSAHIERLEWNFSILYQFPLMGTHPWDAARAARRRSPPIPGPDG